jgi:RimJ/RimL family protein N-acetyltransferase
MRDEYWLTTERLGLRRLTPDDFEMIVRAYSDPEVTRFLGGIKSREQTADLFRTRILDYYDRNPGFGVWATIERATGVCVGMHVLNHIQGEPDIQVGFIMWKEAWGRGFATEGGRALLRYGFVTCGLPRIVGITDLDNVASQRVLQKIGLERRGERTFSHPAYAGHGPFAWFERDAAGWLAAHT